MINNKVFRAYIEYKFEDNDKICKIYLYDVVLYLNGQVGFLRDDLIYMLSLNKDLSDDEIDEIVDYIESNSNCNDEDYFIITPTKAEQYTSLNDKNDDMIYEGDTILIIDDDYNGVVGEVYFNDKTASYSVKVNDTDVNLYEVNNKCEIIDFTNIQLN